MRIGIIGGGFCGTLTAAHIVKKAPPSCEIILFNEHPEQLARGIAYTPYSGKQLLNVVTGKMSAFPSNPDHFLDWVMQQKPYSSLERDIVSQSFLPRRLYGDYLVDIWMETMKIAKERQILLTVVQGKVVDLSVDENRIAIHTEDEEVYRVSYA